MKTVLSSVDTEVQTGQQVIRMQYGGMSHNHQLVSFPLKPPMHSEISSREEDSGGESLLHSEAE